MGRDSLPHWRVRARTGSRRTVQAGSPTRAACPLGRRWGDCSRRSGCNRSRSRACGSRHSRLRNSRRRRAQRWSHARGPTRPVRRTATRTAPTAGSKRRPATPCDAHGAPHDRAPTSPRGSGARARGAERRSCAAPPYPERRCPPPQNPLPTKKPPAERWATTGAPAVGGACSPGLEAQRVSSRPTVKGAPPGPRCRFPSQRAARSPPTPPA